MPCEKPVPCLEVWLSRLPETVQAQPVYPPERAMETERVQNDALRRRKIWDWRVLDQLVRARLGRRMEDMRFTKSAEGKWLCDDLCLSLSHSDNWVAVAISDKAVGADIEEVSAAQKRRFERIAHRILNDEEKLLFAQADALTLLGVWTRKESLYKMNGSGAFAPQSLSSLDEHTKTYLILGEVLLSVSALSNAPLRVCLWDEDGIKPTSLREADVLPKFKE